MGTVDLSLSSEQPVGGTEANVYYQTAPIIDGPVVSTTTAGSNVQVQASTSTPLSKVAESFPHTGRASVVGSMEFGSRRRIITIEVWSVKRR